MQNPNLTCLCVVCTQCRINPERNSLLTLLRIPTYSEIVGFILGMLSATGIIEIKIFPLDFDRSFFVTLINSKVKFLQNAANEEDNLIFL